MRRWFFPSVLLLAVGLWIACLFMRADLYLFQHGARSYRGDRWVQRCYIVSPHSLWVSVDFNHVSINYEALADKYADNKERPYFAVDYPTYRHAPVPYVESATWPEPQAQIPGAPKRVGPVPPDELNHTLVVGIPQWLIVLLAAIIPSIQLAKWWRRRKEDHRGRGFVVES